MANKLGPFVAKFWEIFWDYVMNYREAEDYGKDEDKEVKELVTSFAEWGWLPGKPVVCIELTDEKKALAISRMESHVMDLENRAVREESAREELAIIKKVFFDDKGKLRTPKYEGTRCYRRSKFFLKGMIARQKIDKELRLFEPEVDFPLDVPCLLVQFANDTDRLVSQLLENEKELDGRKDVNFLSRLKAAKTLYESGYSEGRMRGIFKDGTGQKLYSILEVNRLVPEANLWERLFITNKEDPLYVPAESLSPTKMRALYSVKGERVIPTLEEVEDLITKIKGGGNDSKMASKTLIVGLAKQNPNRFVQVVAQKILDNDTASIPAMFNPLAPHFDYVERIVSAGKSVELLEDLKAFEKKHFPKAEPIVAEKVEEVAVTK